MAQGNFTVCVSPTPSERGFYVRPDGMSVSAQRDTRAQCWAMVEREMDSWNQQHEQKDK